MVTKSIPVKARPAVVYGKNEATAKAIEYFKGDDLAATTFLNKYALRNEKRELLECTPDEMHKRMAKEFGRIEKQYAETVHLNGSKKFLSAYGQEREFLSEDRIYEYFKDFKYIIPQGSVMSTLGNSYVLASLSNCIVLPEIYDSYGGIFYTDQQLAQLFKRRCGVGIDVSSLRPSDMKVSNAAGSTTGAVSFMERFSNTTREVAQNGRRGALMITMDVAHPDIEQFITIKRDLTKVTGANISVRLSDKFMKAVESDGEFELRWPVESESPEITKTVSARTLWDKIVGSAHQSAEPGLIFWDRQHTYSTSSVYPGYKNISTNPCSEIAMQGGDSCRLIAINLYSFVEAPFTDKARFDLKKFYEVTYDAQRLMDDLVDLELEAVEKILAKISSDPEPDFVKQVETDTWKLLHKNGKEGRRTGLGFTGLADAIAAMNIAFDSQESLDLTETIMKTKLAGEFDSSIDMSIERGKFSIFDTAIEETSEFVQMMKTEFPSQYERMMKFGRRNISLSTVAPTGTLSMLAQTSSGIEPVFMTAYKRRRKIDKNDKDARIDYTDAMGDSWQEFTVYHQKLREWMNITGDKAIENSPYNGSTASEIDWMKRIELQSVVQKYVTHSISSTINLPNDVTIEKVGEIYLQAWKKGLKGITVYRDGSRSGVLISTEEKKEKKSESGFSETTAPSRPEALEAEIIRFQNHNEKWIAVVGLLNSKPYEVFTGKAEDAFVIPSYVEKGWVLKNRNENGKSRYDFQFYDKDGYRITIEGLSRSFNKEYWNYAKLISGVLRHGMPLPQVVHLIENLNLYNDSINTWKTGVERALKKFIPDGTEAIDKKCNECGDPSGLYYEEGCLKCKNCGQSKCG